MNLSQLWLHGYSLKYTFGETGTSWGMKKFLTISFFAEIKQLSAAILDIGFNRYNYWYFAVFLL